MGEWTERECVFGGVDGEVAVWGRVWSTDITYIRMAQGFVYLVAVMD